METGPLRFDDRPDVKGKEEQRSREEEGQVASGVLLFLREARTEDLLAFLGALKRSLFCRHSN